MLEDGWRLQLVLPLQSVARTVRGLRDAGAGMIEFSESDHVRPGTSTRSIILRLTETMNAGFRGCGHACLMDSDVRIPRDAVCCHCRFIRASPPPCLVCGIR